MKEDIINSVTIQCVSNFHFPHAFSMEFHSISMLFLPDEQLWDNEPIFIRNLIKEIEIAVLNIHYTGFPCDYRKCPLWSN